MMWKVADTGAEKQACYRLRAEEYRRYYRRIPAGVFTDELDAASLANGRPRTVSVLVGSADEPLGTARLAVGRHPSTPGLRTECEALTTFDPDMHLPAPCQIFAETGKFAVRQGADSEAWKSAVCEGVARVALGIGVERIVLLLSPFVVHALVRCGGRLRAVPGVRLRRETLPQLRYLLEFSDYFLPTLRTHTTETDTDLATLQELTRDCPDGPAVFVTEPGEMLDGILAARAEGHR